MASLETSSPKTATLGIRTNKGLWEVQNFSVHKLLVILIGYFISQETYKLLSRKAVLYHFTSNQGCINNPVFLLSHQNLISLFLILVILIYVEWHLLVFKFTFSWWLMMLKLFSCIWQLYILFCESAHVLPTLKFDLIVYFYC